MKRMSLMLGGCVAAMFSVAAHAESLTIATVNTGDLTRMQQLSEEFTKNNPDIQLDWVTLEEGFFASA